jgi:hypothetical protein
MGRPVRKISRYSPEGSGLGRSTSVLCFPYLLANGMSWVDMRQVFSSVMLRWVDLIWVFSPCGWDGLICGNAPDLLPISGWVDLENAPPRRS